MTHRTERVGWEGKGRERGRWGKGNEEWEERIEDRRERGIGEGIGRYGEGRTRERDARQGVKWNTRDGWKTGGKRE